MMSCLFKTKLIRLFDVRRTIDFISKHFSNRMELNKSMKRLNSVVDTLMVGDDDYQVDDEDRIHYKIHRKKNV